MENVDLSLVVWFLNPYPLRTNHVNLRRPIRGKHSVTQDLRRELKCTVMEVTVMRLEGKECQMPQVKGCQNLIEQKKTAQEHINCKSP